MKIIPLLTAVTLQVSLVAPVKAQIISDEYTDLLFKSSYELCMFAIKKQQNPNDTALLKAENDYLKIALYNLFDKAKVTTEKDAEEVQNHVSVAFGSCLYTITRQKMGK